jgi:hypothetical protein
LLQALSSAVINGYRTVAPMAQRHPSRKESPIAIFISGFFLVEPAIKGLSSWMSNAPLHETSPLPTSQWASHVKYATTHIEDLFGNEDDPNKFWAEINHLVQATAIWGPASGVPAMFYNIVKPVVGAMKEKKEPRKKD